MKKLNKLAALAAAAAMILSLAACTGASAGKTDKYTIGAVQLMEHAALDACYNGFVQALEDNGYADKVEITLQNAQGDPGNLSTIGDRLVSTKVDMILAITTDAAQAMAAKTSTIPILATAVTSYTVSGLVADEAAPGGNVSGTSDMNPVAAQIDLILELVPEAATIGLIYNSGEDNSVLQITLAKERIEALGLKWAEVTVTNTGDVQQAVQSIAGKCDALYIPTDNVVAAAMPTVHSVAMENKLPTICGESGMVMSGGLATMGIDYYQLGYKTGLMAIEVINGKDVGQMPIQYADSSEEVTINGLVAQEIGYTVPEKYLPCVIYP